MVLAQKVKEAEITKQESLLLTRNLLRISIFHISYARGLFPQKYFNDVSVPALGMKIKKLLPLDPESRRLIDWMEKGVCDALQKKYLRTLLFCICEAVDGPIIEEYAFSFSYSGSDSPDISMNINCTGNKIGGTFTCDAASEVTPSQMKRSACKMILTLVQVMETLDKMPDKRVMLMKLLYYEDVTPVDYEPPFFRSCTPQEAHHSWTKNPLKMEFEKVDSNHFVLGLKVKSVLDPREDENEDLQDHEGSLWSDSLQTELSLDSVSEVGQSQEDQYIVAPIEKQVNDGNGTAEEDNTQDSEEDEQQLIRVKEWIASRQRNVVELTDVLSKFPDISVVLTEEIMERLVKEGLLSRAGKDSYTINGQKMFSAYDFTSVKEENDGLSVPKDGKNQMTDDYMYMKALYHILPTEYVSIAKLRNKLDGKATQTTVQKLIDRMIRDGYIEATGKRRLGKRVIHSVFTERKLKEIKKALDPHAMDVDGGKATDKLHSTEAVMRNNRRDISTYGGIHSIGSDLTRMKGRSDLKQSGLIRSEQTMTKSWETGNNTPISMAERTIASRESFARVKNSPAANVPGNGCCEADTSTCSREKRRLRTCRVSESILGNVKRQRPRAF